MNILADKVYEYRLKLKKFENWFENEAREYWEVFCI